MDTDNLTAAQWLALRDYLANLIHDSSSGTTEREATTIAEVLMAERIATHAAIADHARSIWAANVENIRETLPPVLVRWLGLAEEVAAGSATEPNGDRNTTAPVHASFPLDTPMPIDHVGPTLATIASLRALAASVTTGQAPADPESGWTFPTHASAWCLECGWFVADPTSSQTAITAAVRVHEVDTAPHVHPGAPLHDVRADFKL